MAKKPVAHIAAQIFIVFTLTLFAFASFGQETIRLNDVGSKDTIATGQAVIYGNFVQRLGFKSGGFAQEMYIVNVATKEVMAFRVKPTFKSAKENAFIYHIKPGTYTVFMYQYVESKWYGAKIFKEPVQKADGGNYTFTIPPNSLVNVGNWNFDKYPGTFNETNGGFNEKMRTDFSKLDFGKAIVVIPK